MAVVVSTRQGAIKTADGAAVTAAETFTTTASVLFDAVYVPGGQGSYDVLHALGTARHFVAEAFKHSKPIGATGEGVGMLAALPGVTLAGPHGKVVSDKGVVTERGAPNIDDFAREMIHAIAQHRFWDRDVDAVSA